jgi:hypothetical protein
MTPKQRGKGKDPITPEQADAFVEEPKTAAIVLNAADFFKPIPYKYSAEVSSEDGTRIGSLQVFCNRWQDHRLKTVQLSLVYKHTRILGLDVEPRMKQEPACPCTCSSFHFQTIKGNHKQSSIISIDTKPEFIRFLEDEGKLNRFASFTEILEEFLEEANIRNTKPKTLFDHPVLEIEKKELRLSDDHYA